MKNSRMLMVLAVLVLSASSLAFGAEDVAQGSRSRAVPSTIAFQGFLADASGLPIEGAVALDLALYNTALGGSAIWSEHQAGVTVSEGVFAVALGHVNPLTMDLFDGSPLWLGVDVDSTGELPRTSLQTAPFAFRAAVADSAATFGVADDGDWTVSGADVYRASGAVGIGTATPGTVLHIKSQPGAPSNAHLIRLENADAPNLAWEVHHRDSGSFALFEKGDLEPAIEIDAAGNVGLGTATPTSRLDVKGTAKMEGLEMSTGAQQGYVLTADSLGVATWQPGAGGGSGIQRVFSNIAVDSMDVLLTNAIQSVISATITVPGPGVIAAHANTALEMTTNNSGERVVFSLSDNTAAHNQTFLRQERRDGLVPSLGMDTVVDLIGEFPVSAGTTTIHLLADRAGVNTQPKVRQRSLHLVFYPN